MERGFFMMVMIRYVFFILMLHSLRRNLNDYELANPVQIFVFYPWSVSHRPNVPVGETPAGV
jgi:hypothetical protein